jgi:uncharacterized protein (TIRG00374 family)
MADGPGPAPSLAAPSNTLGPSTGGSWGRRHLRSGVILLAGGLSLYVLLPSLLSLAGSWRSLERDDWYFVLLVLAFEALSSVFLWELDRVALHTHSWFVVACAQLSGNAVGRVLPGGGATATAFSVSMLRRAGLDGGESAAALGASTLMQLATTLALPLVALPAIVSGAPIDHDLAVAGYLGIAVLALMGVFAGVVLATPAPIGRVAHAVQWFANRTIRRRRPLSRLPEELSEDREFLLRTLGAGWKKAILAAAGNTAFDYLALLAALRAAGADPRPSLVLLAYTSAELLALIPLTPGGLGFVEVGLIGTLSVAGVSGHAAVAAVLLYRLAAYWLPIPAGAVAYLLFRHRYADSVRIA